MDRGKYWLSGFLLLVVLTSSVYFVLNDDVRIDIQKTRSIFQVYENGEWVVSGIEYVNLFDGTAKMRAKSRSLETEIGKDNFTTVTRIANYKDNISTIEIYEFNPNSKDVTLFPVSHSIEVINGEGKLLQYEVQKLLYTGETVKNIESPQSFGHQMKVEWDDGNYYSRIYKYVGKDEGKLTVKYRIDSSDYFTNVRLFDPPGTINVTLNSPDDYILASSSIIEFNSTGATSSESAVKNMSFFNNESGSWIRVYNESWDIQEQVQNIPDPKYYYKYNEEIYTSPLIDEMGLINGTIASHTHNVTGIDGTGWRMQDTLDYTQHPITSDTEYTIGYWYNSAVHATSNNNAMLITEDGSNYQVYASYRASSLPRKLTISMNGQTVSSDNYVIDMTGEWQYHALTVNTTNDYVKYYINGTLVFEYDYTTVLPFTYFRLGDGTQLSVQKATYDEVSYWDEILPQSNISAIFNNGTFYPLKNVDFQDERTITFNQTITNNISWNAEMCDYYGNCTMSSVNRTITQTTSAANISFDSESYNNATWLVQNYIRTGADISQCDYFSNCTYTLRSVSIDE